MKALDDDLGQYVKRVANTSSSLPNIISPPVSLHTLSLSIIVLDALSMSVSVCMLPPFASLSLSISLSLFLSPSLSVCLSPSLSLFVRVCVLL